MLQTQTVIDKTVSQTSEWQTRFREPIGVRIASFIFGLFLLFGGLLMLFEGVSSNDPFASRAWWLAFGVLCSLCAFAALRNSLVHEFHLNFHYRQYDEISGLGPMMRKKPGSFDEIYWVYVRQDQNQSGNYYAMGFAFDEPSQRPQMALYRMPIYDVISVRNAEYLEQYAQTLANKMGRPYTRVNW